MKVELVSFKHSIRTNKRVKYISEIVNQSKADLILFPGDTVNHEEDLDSLQDTIDNHHPSVLIEVRKVFVSAMVGTQKHCPNIIQGGKAKSLFTCQLFSASDHIAKNESLAERFINELETRRKLEVNGKKVLVLQCGERWILANTKEGNNWKSYFRFPNRPDLEDRFFKLLDQTDIILNPVHTAGERSFYVESQAQLLSSHGRCFFYTADTGNRTERVDAVFNQYAYRNGIPLKELKTPNKTNDYLISLYDI